MKFVRLSSKWQRGDRFFWQPVTLCLLFLLIACGAMYCIANLAAVRTNEEAKETSTLLAKTALRTLENDLEGRVIDYAWWDVTIAQVEDGIDPIWADDNIGSYLTEAYGYSGSLVIGKDRSVLYGYQSSDFLPKGLTELTGPQTDVFLEDIQRTTMEHTVPLSRYFVVGDAVVLITAGAITHEYPTEAQLVPNPRNILILYKVIDDALLETIADQYRLAGARLANSPIDGVGVELNSADGISIAALTWDQATPGDDMFHETVPAFVIASVVLLVTASAIYYLWIRAAIATSRAKSQILAKMSHEFRTPLNPIIGFSEMIAVEAVGPVPNPYRDYANDIHQSGKHLQRLVEDLLDLSKIEAGKLELNDSILSVTDIVNAVARMTGSKPATAMAKHPPEIVAKVAPDLPNLKADELRVRQVLINIVSNAAKFSGGKPVAIRADAADGAIRIEVEDEGHGISKDDIERVLMPFEQAVPNQTKNPGEGAGLGLAISRELMGLHGGTLNLQSELGKGTLVTLTFPRHRSIAA